MEINRRHCFWSNLHIYIVHLCLERDDLLTQVIDMPEFNSRCSSFEPWYFKLWRQLAHHVLSVWISNSSLEFSSVWYELAYCDESPLTPLPPFPVLKDPELIEIFLLLSILTNLDMDPLSVCTKGTLWHMLTWAYIQEFLKIIRYNI